MTILSRVLTAGVLCLLPVAAAGQPAALKARKVHDRVRVQVDTVDTPKPGSVVVYSVDTATGEFETLEPNKQFVAAGSAIAITVPRFNPLKTAITITVEDAVDPSHESVSKLVESLLSMSTILGAKLEPAGNPGMRTVGANVAGCTETEKQVDADLVELSSTLNDAIFSGTRIKKEISDAADAIDNGFNLGGPAAILSGVQKLAAFLGANDTSKGTLRFAVAAAEAAIKKVEAEATRKDPDTCRQAVQRLYVLAVLTNPGQRLASLVQATKAVSDILTNLRTYAPSNRWSQADRSEFVARRDINPTPATMKKVKVAFATRQYEESGITPGVMIGKTTDAASAEFIVRRYSAWVPEIGVGLTFSRVKRPEYGTGKNSDGETVIAQVAPKDDASLDPSLMVNFVCGFCGLTPLTPMFQVGVSTSKTSPAMFLGGGIRFAGTAKGDFAFGYGAVLPWAKQLKNEADLNKVISGTAELAEHLEWRRVTGFHSYVTLQYKF